MATQEDKDRKPSADPTSTDSSAKETGPKPIEGKDPDVYDPVGMAGKKAGIVKGIEEKLKQEGTDTSE